MLFTLVDLVLLKTFQKRRVSSPAPVTMASPSGDMAFENETIQYNHLRRSHLI